MERLTARIACDTRRNESYRATVRKAQPPRNRTSASVKVLTVRRCPDRSAHGDGVRSAGGPACRSPAATRGPPRRVSASGGSRAHPRAPSRGGDPALPASPWSNSIGVQKIVPARRDRSEMGMVGSRRCAVAAVEVDPPPRLVMTRPAGSSEARPPARTRPPARCGARPLNLCFLRSPSGLESSTFVWLRPFGPPDGVA